MGRFPEPRKVEIVETSGFRGPQKFLENLEICRGAVLFTHLHRSWGSGRSGDFEKMKLPPNWAVQLRGLSSGLPSHSCVVLRSWLNGTLSRGKIMTLSGSQAAWLSSQVWDSSWLSLNDAAARTRRYGG